MKDAIDVAFGKLQAIANEIEKYSATIASESDTRLKVLKGVERGRKGSVLTFERVGPRIVTFSPGLKSKIGDRRHGVREATNLLKLAGLTARSSLAESELYPSAGLVALRNLRNMRNPFEYGGVVSGEIAHGQSGSQQRDR